MSVSQNNTGQIDFSQINCEICFQNYSQVGSSHAISCLPCGHIFGKNCIFQWLESKKPQVMCPKCKKIFNNSSNTTSKLEDYIITLYGLPCSGVIKIDYEDTNDKLFDVRRELLEVREENSKLRRELDSLRKNFRYLSSQRLNRIPVVTSNYSSSGLLSRLRAQRANNITRNSVLQLDSRQRDTVFDYLTRLTNQNINHDSYNSNSNDMSTTLYSRDNIPEFTVNDEEEYVNDQLNSEDSRDAVRSQPDEIIIISDGEEESMSTDTIEFREINSDAYEGFSSGDFEESDDNQTVSIIFSKLDSPIKETNITDAVLFGEIIVIACKIGEKGGSVFSYGLKFVSSTNSYNLCVSNEPINRIVITKSRDNDNRLNILVASSATVSKILKHMRKITSITWINHKEFAFGTSAGEVIFAVNSNSGGKCPIKQLITATHGYVFAVQGKKMFVHHKDCEKKLIKEYNVDVKYISLNENKNKLFCFLNENFRTVKVLSYMIVEHIRTMKTQLTIEDNSIPLDYEYETTCDKMEPLLFEYTNQTDNYLGFFNYNKDNKQLVVKFINHTYSESINLQNCGEVIKIIADISSKKINSRETLKFAVITNEEVQVYGARCNL
ncbi:Zinc finger, RING-type domain and Zinc finger, RING/FYVE/PHD-type domain-containing protein [Strongyloides ratti]|uniref:Zinc finger, RING-type domain and Zinc finger, RING/FYVE/PHD-type domain-containing protein n=1 Tax=Strongyloides ratti TaxID=34506 RepID=A0A090LLF0_STRRB|nr:Zinc finger, RING-type domain and Zinc finger, RING/FYVE/PHD-type domain-containing protein [Strongyloides ratti]CEF69003.1 Zinc finger, RING-type domain and Zinc finger, RING/FYVE/PHD-type domain-containing protein [Strongyloides ratti]